MKKTLYIILIASVAFWCFVYATKWYNGKSDTSEQLTEYRKGVTTSSDAAYVEDSYLLGTWYCSRQNSCNDMEIILTITQDGDLLYMTRDMVSNSGVGSSNLEGTATAYDYDYAFAEFTVGNYKITDDGYLLEYFARNDRWNIYTRDGFAQKKLEGRYND